MKIGLGTVQFGMNYGISNSEGQTSPSEVVRILEVARNHHIDLVDTAALYGNSEEVLGNALEPDSKFKLTTKTVRIDADRLTSADGFRVERSFSDSLKKLRRRSVYGLMVHNADDLLALDGDILFDSLLSLKSRGLVEKIGASVYSAAQIEGILAKFRIDLIQLPLNVFDQRLLLSGCLKKLKDAGVEIHARSVFLQGLLLMSNEKLPAYFDHARKHFIRYVEFLRDHNLSPLEAALGFACGINEVDAVICGVNDHLQLEKICSSCNPLDSRLFTQFALSDESVVDPSTWHIS